MFLKTSRFLCLSLVLQLLCSCKHNNKEDLYSISGYPKEVERIFLTNCVSCHNEQNAPSSGDIRLDTWAKLFEGGANGSVAIPWSAANSSLLYFINTDSSLGPVAYPTMPYDAAHAPNTATPLSRADYLIIRDWIAAGAPDADGNVAFASLPDTRQKIYLTMQGCDLLAVMDGEKRVVMRYITIGKNAAAIESPHCVRVDAHGRYAYVSFLAGEYVQKIDTRTDSVVAEAHVGVGSWNVFQLSPDGKKMLISDWKENGRVLMINTEDMSILPEFGGDFRRPHGIASNAAFNVFYVTSETENVIYKFSIDNPFFAKVPVDNPGTATKVIHEIMMTPDHKRYFITCQATNEVRVVDAAADTLIKVIPVGIYPQEIALSTTRPYMFVTCTEDPSSFSGFKGSVYAINYETYETTRIDAPFYQPHGIAVDDRDGLFFVASRNANPNGPAPHHSSACAGRNGYYHVFDLNTFARLPKRYEVTVEPYSADTRFK